MRPIDADALKEKIDSMWNGRPLSSLGARILVTIDEAPTIEPKQGWIPCSDRLPKDEGIFLVTMETYVFNEYSHPVGTSFYSPSFGWVNASPNKVLAWMPLPEPWKGAD